MRLPFVKMHGLGNDFVLIDDLAPEGRARAPVGAGLARALCDRRFGVGADQLIWLLPSVSSDALVRFFNADGSEAEMCGNGIRAVAVYLATSGPRPGLERYTAETAGGAQVLDRVGGQVRVEMGAPRLLRGFDRGEGHELIVDGRELKVFELSVGNPHAVIFVDRLAGYPAEEIGPALERHADYPRRTNVEFVEIVDQRRIRTRVWERGAGFTLACGTGACAAAVAAIATSRAASPLVVELPGGEIEIAWEGEGRPVVMAGPAVETFRGEADLDAIQAKGHQVFVGGQAGTGSGS